MGSKRDAKFAAAILQTILGQVSAKVTQTRKAWHPDSSLSKDGRTVATEWMLVVTVNCDRNIQRVRTCSLHTLASMQHLIRNLSVLSAQCSTFAAFSCGQYVQLSR